MLDTIKDLKDINGFKIHRHGEPFLGQFILIQEDANLITFKLQNGATKDFGLNGCSFNTVVSFLRQVLTKLDEKHPSVHNYAAIEHLKSAYIELEKRKADRERRGVYGKDET